MSVSQIYRGIWRVVDVVSARLKIELDITGVDCMKDLELRHAVKSGHDTIRGAVRALDGCWKLQKI